MGEAKQDIDFRPYVLVLKLGRVKLFFPVKFIVLTLRMNKLLKFSGV